MTVIGPFYFAWVFGDETTFTDDMHVMDEDIFSVDIKHDEGQVPTMEIEIRNPRVGLLNPHRKVWAWLAYQTSDGHTVPLFFGVLIGMPTNLFAETITLMFQARSHTFILDKQAVAETMKVRPYWDPVFLDGNKRDNPDAILEGWSSLWHVDRTSLEITASDILVGEDGTAVFTRDDAFYDSVKMTIGQPPLTNVLVQATVNWTQRTIGNIDGPPVNLTSYTGGSFLSDWPKAGTSLGGGWTVESSFVNDVYKVEQTPMSSSSSTWTNNDPNAADGDTTSMSNSATYPALLSPNPLTALITATSQSGICDPDADPPVNRPATVSVTGMVVPLWFLNCSWNLRYDAKRQFSEFLYFNVLTNTQSVLASPLVEQNTETITISGSNVGEPLETAEAWSDFRGQAVTLAQVIFPNNPTTPGGLSYQICVTPGTAGETEPVFSDIPGVTTTDGTVVWSSLGKTPLANQPNWSDSSFVPLGEIIYYVGKDFNPAFGNWEEQTTGTYLIATGAGQTNRTVQSFTYVPPVVNNDEATPAPVVVSFIPGPAFGSSNWTWPGGFSTNRDTVQWTNLGPNPSLLQIPIGGTPLDVTARNYFPSDRGLWSVEYLICKARARLRMRSRAVNVAWDCPFELAIGLSGRMSATLQDDRLPGGTSTGKITSYLLHADGEGKFFGHVETGCAVGFAGTVGGDSGTPSYTGATGYMQPGYQQYENSIITLGDIGYTPPVATPFDDGLSFPLWRLPGGETASLSGSAADQAVAIQAAFPITRMLANLGIGFALSSTTVSGNVEQTTGGISPGGAWFVETQQLLFTEQTVPYVMESHPVRFDMYLKPVTNGPFNGAYGLTVTPLEIPQGINLLADSSV